MVRITLADRRRRARSAQQLAHLLAAAGDRRELVVRAGRGRSPRSPRRRVAVEQRERLRRSAPPARSRVVGLGREHGVHLAVTSPSRRSRARNASGSAAQLLERELPAVDRARDEVLQDPERRARAARRVRRTSRRARRSFGKPCVGEEAQQLELGVDAGLEPAVDLQDQLVVEHDARCSTARRRAGAPRGRAPRAGARPAARNSTSPRRLRRRACGRISSTSSRASAGSASAS